MAFLFEKLKVNQKDGIKDASPTERLLELSILFVLFLAAIGTSDLKAATAGEGITLDTDQSWTACPGPGNFITCLCPAEKFLWVGTEDTGLWRLDLSADPTKIESWRQMSSTKSSIVTDGPGPDIYALAVDAGGRLWVGNQNRGVSVYNGAAWKTYGPLDGCPGDRVFAIAADTDPQRGRVWIGTDRGLTCWTPTSSAAPRPGQGVWSTFTQADGLPSAQIYAVAVAKDGRVWAGTECDGLAWSDPPYKTWTAVRAAAERSGDAGQAPGLGDLPAFSASGLPSNLTNALRVLPDGTVAYATDYGLGLGRKRGQEWSSWQGLSKEPYENYIRNLAVDPAGGLWLASTHMNLARLDPATGNLTQFHKTESPCDCVFAVALTKDGRVWTGTYGSGVACLKVPALAAPADAATATNDRTIPPLPEPVAPPTLAELNAMLAALAEVPVIAPEEQPAVVRLDDDWLTKGDCLGRYGRYWGCWCAICSPGDYVWGGGPEEVKYCATIGDQVQNDSIRYWIHWLHTLNPNSLEMPPTYRDSRVKLGYMPAEFTRREAEWCDDGQAYPLSFDGPDLYCTLRIPPGLYFLSLYAFNVNGHEGVARYRDFPISVREHSANIPMYDIKDFQNQPNLARARLRDFHGGVYKRFLVHGPTEIAFSVNRNHSLNAMLAGVFLDLVDEQPAPYFHSLPDWKKLCAAQEKEQATLRAQPAAERAARFRPAASEAEAAARLFEELERMRLTNAPWWATEGRAGYAALLNWFEASLDESPEGLARITLAAQGGFTLDGPEQLNWFNRATTCCYRLGLYERWECGQSVIGLTTARQIEKSIRWDGVSECSGKGFATITNQLLGTTGPAAGAAGVEGAVEP